MQPDSDNPTNLGSPLHEGFHDQTLSREDQPRRIPPLIAQAQNAFSRDLAQLLKEHPGQWVAYHGDRLIGFAKTKTKLYQECLRKGIDEDEFIVQCIEPETGVLTIGPRSVD